ncbi:MAG: HXXEE domain-containing protein [Streptococcus salivarius]
MTFLSYQFNNYTIYASHCTAYIYHVFGHLIQTIVIRKYVPGLLTGI